MWRKYFTPFLQVLAGDRNTIRSNPPCFSSDGLEWILQPDVFMPRRGNFAGLRVNVSVSPLGLCAGNGRVESVFLCVGSGCGWRVSKSKGSWKSLRRSSIIGEQQTGGGALLYSHTRGNYKSPGVRTSVNRLSRHLNTSCVFPTHLPFSFLKADRSLTTDSHCRGQ